MHNRPGRLHHDIPNWVRVADCVYHIRIRLRAGAARPLTDPTLGPKLLQSVSFYESRARWTAWLFLLMPDHCHGLISFPEGRHFRDTVGDWKRWHETQNGVIWQDNFFDHRLRTRELCDEKWEYIRLNPVAKNLCPTPDDWPWVYYGCPGGTRSPSAFA